MLSWLSAPVWQRDNPINDVTVRKISTFAESFDSFYQVNSVLGLVKNAGYLTWRYLQHPDQKYLSWGAYRSEDLVGYLVMSMADFKCSICELAYLPRNESVVYPLVEAAAQSAQEAGSYLVEAWVPERNPLRSILMKNGFISQHRLHRFARDRENLAEKLYQIILYDTHLPVQYQTQILEDLKFWSLSMGDSDLA
jgi:hypothetical protein